MSDTAIQWASRVWNPLTGCTRVSAGCDHCYAFDLHDKRHLANLKAAKHALVDMGRVGLAAGDASRHAAVKARELGVKLALPAQYDLPFSRVQLMPERLTEPLRWRKPQRVFVNSMGDLFHDDVPDEFIDQVFAVMAATPQHTYIVLTKRPERMREYVLGWWQPTPEAGVGRMISALVKVITGQPMGIVPKVLAAMERFSWPLPNVQMGVSAEDQATLDERIPVLLNTPAAVRVVSLEPLLGPVVLTGLSWWRSADGLDGESWEQEPVLPGHMAGLDWVVVGGESGPHARPCDVGWIRSMVQQCQAAGVPVFVKQQGSNPTGNCPACGGSGDDPVHTWGNGDIPKPGMETVHAACELCEGTGAIRLRDRHGADMAEWSADLRVREVPHA